MLPYQLVFTREALDFICRAGEVEMRELDGWFNRFERQPATPGDYAEQDRSGRELQVVVLRHVAITYWTDDAVREVRIIQIVVNP